MDDVARYQHCQTVHEAVNMPADDQAHSDAQNISDQEKRVGGESGERLFRFLIIPHDGILNRLRTIGVVCEVFTKSRGEMPDANHEKGQYNGAAREIKSLPQVWFDHRDKKCR